MKVENLQDGEPWKLKAFKKNGHVCCQCGLAHIVTSNVDCELVFWRDEKTTKKERKRMFGRKGKKK